MNKRIILTLLVLCQLVGCLAFPAYAEETYCINGVNVRYDDFTSRPGACRVYASKLYNKIWGIEFSSDFYDDDNLLRNLEDEDLTLTEEHLKEYVSQAALGSAIRVSSRRYLHRNDGGAGHTQLIVQKDEAGFTVLEGGMSEYPYYREYYYTWSEFVSAPWLGGKYGYIKYIKWPGAPEYSENYDMEVPEVSAASVQLTGENSFSVSFTATDDLAVEEAYVLVWPQGKTEENAVAVSCQWDGTNAKADVVFESIEDDVRNFYVKCYAADAKGNVGGGEDAKMVSLYQADTEFVGICKVENGSAVIRNAPAAENNGEDTQMSDAEEGAYLMVFGLRQDSEGNEWYALGDDRWISERDLRYHTFRSLLNWILDDAPSKGVDRHGDKILFTCA